MTVRVPVPVLPISHRLLPPVSPKVGGTPIQPSTRPTFSITMHSWM